MAAAIATGIPADGAHPATVGQKDAREARRMQLKIEYEAGASIREPAAIHKVAFGTVRALLLEADVTLRSRGGPNHTRQAGERGATS